MSKEVNAEKLKALQLTMEKLDKTFGKGSDFPAMMLAVSVVLKTFE
jgi:hypothetical protein